MSTRIMNTDNVLRSAYDPPTESLKVSLVGTGSPSMPSIVQLSDGTANLSSTVSGPKRALDVNIINSLGIAIDHTADSIRLGDGTNYFTSTTSGPKVALDVNMLGGTLNSNTTVIPSGPTVTSYGVLSGLAPSTPTINATYTVPVSKTAYIQKLYLSGTQVGTYTIKVNGIAFMTFRTSVMSFSQVVDLSTGSAFGVKCVAGNVVTVVSENNDGANGDFNVTIQVMET